MKKTYSKPTVEVEAYTLTESFAASCNPIINMGPAVPDSDIQACSMYDQSLWDVNRRSSSLFALTRGSSFYESGLGDCDCYYTSSGRGYFTS